MVAFRVDEAFADLVGSLLSGFSRCERWEKSPTATWDLSRALGVPADAGGKSGSSFELRSDRASAVRSHDLAVIVEHLMWRLTRSALEDVEGEIAFHAGAVRGRDGDAVLLAAPGGSGKSTLTAGLVASGWDYLTDELTVLSASGETVEPFARPLCMSPAAVDLFPGLAERLSPELRSGRVAKLQVRPDDIRPGSIGTAGPVRAVVFPRYERGAKTLLQPLGRVATLVTLMHNTFNLAAAGQAGLDTLAALCRAAPGYRLVSGDLGEAVAAVERIAAAA